MDGGVVTGVCESDHCKCLPGYTGNDCKEKTCGVDCNAQEGWGYCNGHDGQCYCESGYGGVDCSIKLIGCPNNCNGNGDCEGEPKSCVCHSGFSGIACEVKACPVGTLQPHSFLLPEQSATGTSASAATGGAAGTGTEGTDGKESATGSEENVVDAADSAATGSGDGSEEVKEPDFSVWQPQASFLELTAPAATLENTVCSQHGVCAPGIGGLCECGNGYYGDDCSCTHDCYNGGTCYGGVCLCAYGWRGLNCSHTICPNDCSTRGSCVDENCQCDVGFGGVDCSERRCPNRCSLHGLCDSGVCICNDGYGGQDCGLKFQGANRINDMICAASESYLNAFYNYRKNELQLEENQIDHTSIVRLNADADFSVRVLQQRRSDLLDATGEISKELATSTMQSVDVIHEMDQQDREEMKKALTQHDVEEESVEDVIDNIEHEENHLLFPKTTKKSNRASGSSPVINMTAVRVGKAARRKWRSELNGIIGMCVKDIPCPHNCTSHVDTQTKLSSGGYCVEGKCKCYPGWGGEDCGERTCFKDCNLHGACHHGICECDKHWEGPYCT